MSEEIAKCGLCGEPMPPGEGMFNYHGYSCPCPKPPLRESAVVGAFTDGKFKDADKTCPKSVDGKCIICKKELDSNYGLASRYGLGVYNYCHSCDMYYDFVEDEG